MAFECDRLVTAALAFALVFGPFAFGSVHPVAYGLLEIVSALAVLLWLVRLRSSRERGDTAPVLPAKIWAPLVGFVSIVAVQIVPLPPELLRWISPSTYEAWAIALPGWPERAPYEGLVRELLARDSVGVQPSDLTRPITLPGVEEEEGGGFRFPSAWEKLSGEALLDPEERARLERWVERDHAGPFAAWRSISLDPARTGAELLKILAYFGFFCVATLHPFSPGSADEARFRKRLLWVAVATGAAVAAVGLLQRYAWNGKILWFFVPWDWGAPRLETPQTSGPFVSRNNFGGYLALLLPLALGPVLARSRMDLPFGRRRTQVAFGCVSAVMGVALLFSLSRGSWLASVVGIGVLLGGVARWIPASGRSRFLRSGRGWAAALLVSSAAVLVLLRVPTGGSAAGNEIDRRLQQTIGNHESWHSRVESWRDSLPMIADFPVLGVGLGAWGTIFPKYDESPFFGTQARRAHNDYVQALAETGLIGGALLIALGVAVGGRLGAQRREEPESARVVSIAIVAGVAALLTHELVDFDLQIPGIASTVAILVGLALRSSWRRVPVARFASNAGPWIVASCVVALVAVAGPSVEPLPRARERSPAALLQVVARHPLSSEAHARLAASTFEYVPSTAAADTAIALNPSSPVARDLRTMLAWSAGDDEVAIEQVEESFFRAPSRAVHPWYFGDAPRASSDAERRAMRAGFERAIREAGYRAAYEFALVLRSEGDPEAEAEAWLRVADLAAGPRDQAVFLRAAAVQLVHVGRLDEAEATLGRARDLAPDDFRIWTTLIAGVLGGRGDLSAAERAVAEADALGADPYETRLALAEVARAAEEYGREREILEAAVSLRPAEPRAQFLLGISRYRSGDWSGAAAALRRAVDLKPEMAESWYYLGHSEEKRYALASAGAAYRRALALSPGELRYRRSLDEFEGRLGRAGGGRP